MQSQFSEELSRFFEKKNRDYIPFSLLKTGVSIPLSDVPGIAFTKISQKEIEDLIKPHLTPEYSVRKKGNSRYLLRGSIPDLIINYARNHPKLTLNQIFSYLPVPKDEFSDSVNMIIRSGAADVFITPLSKGFGVRILPRPVTDTLNEKEEIKKAYSRISRGRSYVKIFELRRCLAWPENRFDMAIRKLWQEGSIDLQASSQNLLSEEERRDSYLDKNNVLRILLIWRK